jgi:hypothetical protein
LPFQELITYLVTRAIGTTTDTGKVIQSQDDFADKYAINRATLRTWLKGSETPTIGTMQTVIKGEGFEIKDCIQLPESIRMELRNSHPDIFSDAEEILLHGTPDHVKGLHAILHSAAVSATAQRRIDKRRVAKQGSAAKQRKKQADPLKKQAG